MANLPSGNRDSFGSKFGVIAAAAGSAVGLGNIWRFPLVTAQNGGGAFLLLYIGFIVGIGIPVMLSEFTIGRRAQLNAMGSFKKLAPKTPWFLVGSLGIVTAFAILAFYSTVAGWTIEYLIEALSGKLIHIEDTSQNFAEFSTDPVRPVIWQLVIMFVTGGVVYAGIHGLAVVAVVQEQAVARHGAEAIRVHRAPWQFLRKALAQVRQMLGRYRSGNWAWASQVQPKRPLSSVTVITIFW